MKDGDKWEGNLPRGASKFSLCMNVFMAWKSRDKSCFVLFFETMSNNKERVLTGCQIYPNGSVY